MLTYTSYSNSGKGSQLAYIDVGGISQYGYHRNLFGPFPLTITSDLKLALNPPINGRRFSLGPPQGGFVSDINALSGKIGDEKNVKHVKVSGNVITSTVPSSTLATMGLPETLVSNYPDTLQFRNPSGLLGPTRGAVWSFALNSNSGQWNVRNPYNNWVRINPVEDFRGAPEDNDFYRVTYDDRSIGSFSYTIYQKKYESGKYYTQKMVIMNTAIGTFSYWRGVWSMRTNQVVITSRDDRPGESLTEHYSNVEVPLVIVSPCFNYGGASPITDHALQVFEDQIRSQANAILLSIEDMSHYTSCRQAVQGIDALDMNNIENASQMKSIKQMLPPVKELLQMRKHPIQGLANLHLWLKYSVGTTARDIEELSENIHLVSSSIESLSARELVKYGTDYKPFSFGSCSTNVKLTSKVSVTARLITEAQAINRKLAVLGLDFSLANVWDTITLSFVLDWFISVGSFLENVDYALTVNNSNYDLHYHTTGAKVSVSRNSGDFNGCPFELDNVEIAAYSRRVFSTFPRNEFSFGSSNPTRHFFDGLALIVSNMK